MKRDEFEKILDGILNDIRKLFIEKRSQYATDEKVLHNFKDVALFNNTTPEDALWGFVSKHLSSIKLMINFDKLTETDNRFTYAQYKDKCMDVINYMILLMAIVADRDTEKVGKKIYIEDTNGEEFGHISTGDVGFKFGSSLEQKISGQKIKDVQLIS